MFPFSKPSSSRIRKPLTKVCYDVMGGKKLRERLKEIGLSTKGDREVNGFSKCNTKLVTSHYMHDIRT